MTVAGCVFYPGISARDDRFFTDPPYIAAGAEGYRLAWRYGSLGCAFYPEGEVVEGGLQFRLLAATSTACAPRRRDSIRITRPEQVQALESKGAFWIEPDGTRLKLEIRSE